MKRDKDMLKKFQGLRRYFRSLSLMSLVYIVSIFIIFLNEQRINAAVAVFQTTSLFFLNQSRLWQTTQKTTVPIKIKTSKKEKRKKEEALQTHIQQQKIIETIGSLNQHFSSLSKDQTEKQKKDFSSSVPNEWIDWSKCLTTKQANYKYLTSPGSIDKNLVHFPDAVDYPVDKHFKRWFYSEGKGFLQNDDIALDQIKDFKRVNCTKQLAYKYIKKFDKDPNRPIDLTQVDINMPKVVDQYFNALQEDKDTFLQYILDEDFLKVQEEMNSKGSPGHPLMQYYKTKKEAFYEARDEANKVIQNHGFDKTLEEMHGQDILWALTTRAKIIENKPGVQPAARVLEYQPFFLFLLAARISMPINRIVAKNKYKFGSAIGHSWFKEGTNRFAQTFLGKHKDTPNKNLADLSFSNSDIASWDTSMHPKLIEKLAQFYSRLLDKFYEQNKEVYEKTQFQILKDIFIKSILDMCKAKLIMPDGVILQTNGGMKSGFSDTANSNTIVHKMIDEHIVLIYQLMNEKYGDDNLDDVTHLSKVEKKDLQQVRRENYRRHGFDVKIFQEGSLTRDVDFLSKHIIQNHDGNYVPFRNTGDTLVRLCYPDVMKFPSEEKPRIKASAERALGHLIDNYYNIHVRNIIVAYLHYLCQQNPELIRIGAKAPDWVKRELSPEESLNLQNYESLNEFCIKIENLYFPKEDQPPDQDFEDEYEYQLKQKTQTQFLVEQQEIIKKDQYVLLGQNIPKFAKVQSSLSQRDLIPLIQDKLYKLDDDSRFREQLIPDYKQRFVMQKQSHPLRTPRSKGIGFFRSAYAFNNIRTKHIQNRPNVTEFHKAKQKDHLLMLGSHPGNDYCAVVNYMKDPYSKITAISILPPSDPVFMKKALDFKRSQDQFIKADASTFDYRTLQSTYISDVFVDINQVLVGQSDYPSDYNIAFTTMQKLIKHVPKIQGTIFLRLSGMNGPQLIGLHRLFTTHGFKIGCIRVPHAKMQSSEIMLIATRQMFYSLDSYTETELLASYNDMLISSTLNSYYLNQIFQLKVVKIADNPLQRDLQFQIEAFMTHYNFSEQEVADLLHLCKQEMSNNDMNYVIRQEMFDYVTDDDHLSVQQIDTYLKEIKHVVSENFIEKECDLSTNGIIQYLSKMQLQQLFYFGDKKKFAKEICQQSCFQVFIDDIDKSNSYQKNNLLCFTRPFKTFVQQLQTSMRPIFKQFSIVINANNCKGESFDYNSNSFYEIIQNLYSVLRITYRFKFNYLYFIVKDPIKDIFLQGIQDRNLSASCIQNSGGNSLFQINQ